MTIESININDYEVRKGAFALVLLDRNKNIAYKLFKSFNHTDLEGTNAKSFGELVTNSFRIRVFEKEMEAYNLIQNSSVLRNFTPKYFGQVLINNIMNDSIEVTNQYLNSCCMRLELIEGIDKKLYTLNNQEINAFESKYQISLESLKKEFKDNGINYLTDSSVFLGGGQFKIIDFSTIDPNEYEPVLG